jgi:uncharacterized membrane protein
MKIKPIWFALILGAFAFVSLILFVYAFMQQAEANRQRALATACMQNSEEIAFELQIKNEELTKLTDRLNQQLIVAEENLIKAKEAAEQASKSKNKK